MKNHLMSKIAMLGFLVVLFAQTLWHITPVATVFALLPRKVVVIDAGHGGWDPGKVGGDMVIEKDANLQIAAKLQSMLEQSGAFVITTRVQDEALGDRKRSDMQGRREIVNTGQADLMISIHQNAYEDSRAKGAQVFYYSASEESKRLAECIQTEIKAFVQAENNREAKANSSYYVLKQTDIPAVIVECGFLSNPEERKNIADSDYQEKIAWAIFRGILVYFDTIV